MLKKAALLLLILLALFLRTYQSGAIGLAEDEANKLRAIESYRKGDFSANAEHPMLMKLASWGCLGAAGRWNSVFPGARITPETAVRFPAALAGSLLVLAVYLLGAELFSPAIGLIAATLWAFDVNSIALSRIAKEDVIVTLFFVLGNFFLLRAKRFHFTDDRRANLYYMACGASFGMLMAAKYIIPYPWITLIFYDLYRFKAEPRWRLKGQSLFKLYSAFAVAFILFNPVILRPETLDYLWRHFTHGRLLHNGYYMLGQIYPNKTYYTFWGTPAYFYALYFFVKTPLPVLASFGAGLLYSFRRWRQENYFFLLLYFVLWFVLLTLPGGKFTRYAITILPAVLLIEALGIYLVYTKLRGHFSNLVLLGMLLLLTAGWYAVVDHRYHPYYSLYVASQGGGKSKWGYYFPQDDLYDAGLREAIAYVSVTAPPNSTVFGNTQAAFEYYQQQYGRPDLKYEALTNRPLNFAKNSAFIIYQDYRLYNENFYLMVFTRAELKPLFTASAKEVPAAEVYFLSTDTFYARSPFWKAKHWPGLLAPLSKLSPAN